MAKSVKKEDKVEKVAIDPVKGFREETASKILAALSVNVRIDVNDGCDQLMAESVVKLSVELADQLIEELK